MKAWVLALALLAGAGEARAQYLSIPEELIVGIGIGINLFASSVVMGIGSLHEARIGKVSWATWSGAALGVTDLSAGAVMIFLGATRRGEQSWFMPGAIALAQGAGNLAMAILSFGGWANENAEPAFVPLVLRGRAVGGKAWTGLGVEVRL